MFLSSDAGEGPELWEKKENYPNVIQKGASLHEGRKVYR